MIPKAISTVSLILFLLMGSMIVTRSILIDPVQPPGFVPPITSPRAEASPTATQSNPSPAVSTSSSSASQAPSSPATPTPTPTPKAQSLAEIAAQHATRNDCYIIYNGGLYNITSYIPNHPGGPGEIIPYCGKEATSAFDTMGGQGSHSGFAENLLRGYRIQ